MKIKEIVSLNTIIVDSTSTATPPNRKEFIEVTGHILCDVIDEEDNEMIIQVELPEQLRMSFSILLDNIKEVIVNESGNKKFDIKKLQDSDKAKRDPFALVNNLGKE